MRKYTVDLNIAFQNMEKDIEKVRYMFNKERVSRKKIVEMYDVTWYQLKKLFKKYNIQADKNNPKYKNTTSAKSELEGKLTKMFYENMYENKIAEILNVSISTVSKLIDELNLKRKPLKNKWSKKRAEAYVYTYTNHGSKAAAERFNLSRLTTSVLVSKFRKQGIKPIDHEI